MIYCIQSTYQSRPFTADLASAYVCAIFGWDCLKASINLALHQAIMKSVMSHACASYESPADIRLSNSSAYETRITATFEVFRGLYRFTICTRISKLRACLIVSRYYGGSKHK